MALVISKHEIKADVNTKVLARQKINGQTKPKQIYMNKTVPIKAEPAEKKWGLVSH